MLRFTCFFFLVLLPKVPPVWANDSFSIDKWNAFLEMELSRLEVKISDSKGPNINCTSFFIYVQMRIER